jgi:excinuclease UvrABC nuclease subunit
VAFRGPKGWLTIENDEAYKLINVNNYPGVYVIYLDDRLAYIGQGKDLRRRLLTHNIASDAYGYITPWISCSDLKIKFKYSQKKGDWLMLEYRLINRLKPNGNKRDKEHLKTSDMVWF